MSDELATRMRAAADAAVIANTPEPVAAAQAEATDEPALADGEAGLDAAAPDADQAEEPSEAAIQEPDMVDEILAVRQDAQRRVRKAEQRAVKLEADLRKATESAEMGKKQLVDELFKKLRRSPARTFEEYGYKFQDLIEAGMREGNSADMPFVNDLDEVKQELAAIKAEREELRRQREESSKQERETSDRTSFLTLVSKDEFPTLFTMFKGHEDALYAEARKLAHDHYKEHGRVPGTISVIQYLETRYRERVGQAGALPAAAPKVASKNLTTKAASESRSSGKPYGQLDRDQQRDALLKAVQQATSRPAN